MDNETVNSSDVKPKSARKPRKKPVVEPVTKLGVEPVTKSGVEFVKKSLKVQIILEGDMLDYVMRYCEANFDLPKSIAVKMIMQRGIDAISNRESDF